VSDLRAGGVPFQKGQKRQTAGRRALIREKEKRRRGEREKERGGDWVFANNLEH
jgi:hypothetical protein